MSSHQNDHNEDGDDMTEAALAEIPNRSTPTTDERYAEVGELIVLHRGDWAEEDYLALPAGTRAELHDGRLMLLPSPEREHQFAALELAIRFREIIGDRNLIFPETDVRMAQGRRYRTPDLTILRERGVRKPFPPDKVLLVAEVISPGGDEYRQKLDAYRDAGIEWYLLLDPTGEPVAGYAAELLRLSGDEYVPVAKASARGVLHLPEALTGSPDTELDLSEFILDADRS